MHEIITMREARSYLLDIYGVDLHDFSQEDYRTVSEYAFFLAVTCVDLARRILQARAIGDSYGIRLHGRTDLWQLDTGYIEEKAVQFRALLTEIDVCRELLNLAIVPFVPKRNGS
jgi:hypothetical protein